MSDIAMPRLSDSMEEGTVLRWLKQPGEEVAAGEELVEIETDKATMTYESPEGGTLSAPVAEGTTHAVGAVIAALGAATKAEASEALPADDPASPTSTPASGESSSLVAQTRSVSPIAAAHLVLSNGSIGSGGANGSESGKPARATPLARRIAAAHGLELASVTGTGPRGRITRSDVAAVAGLSVPAPAAAPATRSDEAHQLAPQPVEQASLRSQGGAAAPDGAKGDMIIQDLTRAQQVIARRMAEAKATVPHFQVQTEVVLDALLELRGRLKAHTDQAPSINDFIVKASATALREFPLANGSYREGRFELHDRINVGVAVATDNVLIVPTVVDADWRSLGAIASETRRLAGAVRAGTITPAELSGATFTVSNLGMYGMTAITPVVNLPEAAILGVGSARPVLARGDGGIVDRQLMTLTLSCDHRILYGAGAAQFLSRIRELLEQPLRLAF
jgi:pyruvate dehydrogenase E2 component (dihydrolipoamide acetyltransferase)